MTTTRSAPTVNRANVRLWLLRNAPLLLFVLTFLIFGLLSDRFLQYANLENIVKQASYIGIVAVGMTFVILTGGIDLSVGSLMYLSAAFAGTFLLGGSLPIPLAVVLLLVFGMAAGLVNALAITRLRIVPFIVTLATLAIFKGVGLTVTQSRAVNFPPEILAVGTTRLLGVPTPIVIFGLVVLIAWVVLNRTPFGRHVYAVGADPEAAKKAGINVDRVLLTVYIISGMCAALGGLVLVGQFGIVNAGFGEGDEFDAIAAVVLGGASLFGGRGTVFPGTVLGAVLVQMVTAGLIFTQVDIYLQPLVFAAIIYLAVLTDSQRTLLLTRLTRRNIRQVRS
ncbi:ABC transporter permease [Deinococcus planocerae]|uniref:ABC transporter permease n=1 Tax=Deinococcus planocerae TaxID=1737569 RepID=UPI000C7F2980|nr:ABC transporter permease [Deinococcus planocerae]